MAMTFRPDTPISPQVDEIPGGEWERVQVMEHFAWGRPDDAAIRNIGKPTNGIR